MSCKDLITHCKLQATVHQAQEEKEMNKNPGGNKMPYILSVKENLHDRVNLNNTRKHRETEMQISYQ